MLTVKERGDFVATMRYVHVWLMETLAAWVPTTPEMEVKLLFGEHIWDAAQHADTLGKRTFELRLPLQHSLQPADPYLGFLKEVANIKPTPERIAAVYDVVLPAIASRYRRYLEDTDRLLDAPTVRILERHLSDTERMIDSARSLRKELSALNAGDSRSGDAWRAREAALQPVAAGA